MSQYYDMISAHYIRDRDHLTNVVASLTWHTMTSWLRRPLMTGRSKTRSHRWALAAVSHPLGSPGRRGFGCLPRLPFYLTPTSNMGPPCTIP